VKPSVNLQSEYCSRKNLQKKNFKPKLKHFSKNGVTLPSHISISQFHMTSLNITPLHRFNHIGGVMNSMLTLSSVDCGFQPRSDQTKDNKSVIVCFSSKHAALRRKSKDWLARSQDNVSDLSDMSTSELYMLFQCASTILKIQVNMLVKYKVDIIIISLNIRLFCHDIHVAEN
jgi:hypothetical protein